MILLVINKKPKNRMTRIDPTLITRKERKVLFNDTLNTFLHGLQVVNLG